MIPSMREWAHGKEHIILNNSDSQTDVLVPLLFLSMHKRRSAESDCGATCAAKEHTTTGFLSVCFILLQTPVPSEYN